MPSGSIFSQLRSLVVDCQKFRDTDDTGCDGPGSQECLGCEFLTETAGDIIDMIVASLNSDEVRDAIRRLTI